MNYRIFIYVVLFCIAFQGCCPPFGDCGEELQIIEPTSAYEPIFLERAEFETSIVLNTATAIDISGKIYVKDNLLFINELYKGFHVYDNSDPANPKAIKFLAAPGATDMAIRDNMIYINQATDLIAVSYRSDHTATTLTKRLPNTFPTIRSPDGFDAYNIPENSVVIDWKLKN